MFEDTNESVDAFAALMDDSGNMPGDDNFVAEEAEEQTADAAAAEALEEHVDLEEEEDEGEEPESDEPEGEEDDPEGDPEEAKPELDPETTMVDLEIDGEMYEVNLVELQSGYLRNEELVKRTSELEAAHVARLTELEAKEAELVAELEAYTIQGVSDLRAYEQINWRQLQQDNPEEYQAKRLEFLDKREQLQAQINRRNTIRSMQEQAAKIKHDAYLKEQHVLINKLLPDFEKPEFQSDLVKYGESIGFSEDEIRGIADARQLVVLDAARKYAASQLKKKEVLAKKKDVELPEVIKPGTKRPPSDAASKRSKLARQRVADEQTIDAAAAAFLDFV